MQFTDNMDFGKNVILASKSPRRSQILKMIGLDFEIVPSNEEEKIIKDISAIKLSEFLSKKKLSL